MRILFIDHTLPQLLKDAKSPIGGWAVQLRLLLIALRESGHVGGVLTWKGANDYVGQQSVCELVETFDRARGVPFLRFFNYRFPSMIAAARSFQPDILVQSCSGMDTGTMAFIASQLDVPFVHYIASDNDADGCWKKDLKRWQDRISYRYGLWASNFVICQNRRQFDHIQKSYPGKPAKIVYNAIEIPKDMPHLRSKNDRGYVAWLGAGRPQKNLPLLRDIAQTMPDIEFRVAGDLVKNADAATNQAAKDLAALPNVRLLGYLTRKTVSTFLEGAIALLCTSDVEGFANIFLESLLAGTPIVARRMVDPDSIFAENRLGLIVSDKKALPNALNSIYALSPSEFALLSKRCRMYVECNHRPAEFLQKLMSAFEPLVAASRNG